MTEKHKMRVDIDRWLSSRLNTVIGDAVDRYITLNISRTDVASSLITILLSKAVTAVDAIRVDPEVATELFSAMLKYRSLKKKDRPND